MQNLLIEERKQELIDQGKKDPAEQADDAELQRLEDVSQVLKSYESHMEADSELANCSAKS